MSSKKKGPTDTTAFYADLVKFGGAGDYEKALKAANRILNAAPTDPDAFHCKIVCLIHLGRFEDILKQCEDKDQLLVFERAYALYRLNRVEEALELLELKKSLETREKELKAQVLYRLERFEECFDLYRDLIKNTSDDFDTERLTNMSAASVYTAKSKPPVQSAEDDDTYELCYNRACHLLSTGKWEEGEKTLEKAEEMCKEFLKEELEDTEDGELEEELEKEVAIIRVQLGFAKQMQGKEKDAQAIYNQVLKTKPSDVGLVAVASNNLVAVNRDQNIFDSKKRIKTATTSEGLEHKLTTAHRRTIARNNLLLAMYTNQVDLCRSLIQELATKFGLDSEDQAFIESGVLSRAGKTQEAVDILLPRNENHDLEKCLIAAQIYLERGRVHDALQVLHQRLVPEDRFRPGVLSALVTLHLAAEDRIGAAQLLKEAVTFNRKEKRLTGGTSAMNTIWRKTAEFHLRGSDPQVAAQALEELLRAEPHDRQTLAQLVLAYAKFDLTKALEASKKLPEFAAAEVDVNSLEEGAFLGAKKAKPASGALASPKPKTPGQKEEETLLLKKRKKKRKKRFPKNYNPDVDPDPERWLPRRERTGYRKPRKERRKGEKFTGAQGTSAAQSENFDYSQKATLGTIPKTTKKSPPEPTQGPRQQQRKPQQKKKGKSNKNRF